MNVIEETTTTVTKQLENQAIESSCKNAASQSCWTAQWYVFASSLAIAIFVFAVVGSILTSTASIL